MNKGSMRKPFIAGNWKMNTNLAEGLALVSAMLDDLQKVSDVDSVLCPPFISLQPIRDLLKGTSIQLGAQNVYFKESGAYTGEVSPRMLAGLCKWVILGHSERRQYFLETDAVVNAKVKAALAAGLLPIFCIGETLEQNEAGKTGDVLSRQVREGLKDIAPEKAIVIAYEPIWAIGTGKAATGAQAGQIIGLVRSTLAELWGSETAAEVRILYGGSVTAANIAEFVSQRQIDGALVGGASLKAADFVEMVRRTAKLRSQI
jgi:triosephosphate isomerase (TIM)